MKLSRRQLLQAAAVLGSAVPLTACERVTSEITQRLGETIPDSVGTAGGAEIDPTFHLLSRAAYGPWPGELDRVKQMGAPAWIEEQLNPAGIDDRICELRARRFETLQLDPGTCYEYKKPVLRDEIMRHTLIRAVYSKRQLFEVMVGFWTDHLNINIDKSDCIYLKPSDDRLVVRKNALGKFRDMIRASATSPAMLVYLDGNENKKDGPNAIPNENYARELLELHTLGVHGGYTQTDVYEVARCLTGWHLRTPWQRATVYMDSTNHDDGEKHVLGHVIPAGGGEKDLERVIDIVCNHPSTAQHLSTKLVRHFVADPPPPALVAKVATTFTATGGDIKETMRTLLTSDEFAAARGTKFKRPIHYICSCLRLLGADTYAHDSLTEYLGRMGQGPFQYPTPDGYPEKTEHWLGTLLWRWNFALAVAANNVPTVTVSLDKLAQSIATGAGNGNQPNRKSLEAAHIVARSPDQQKTGAWHPNILMQHFIGRAATQEELAALTEYIARSGGALSDDHKAELIGLILASPAFQRY
jgi:uncharacterized protein (DUF1800 family)